MSSHLSCIGFDVADAGELESLVVRLMARAYPLGTADGVDVLRWEDPSGARLTVSRAGNRIVDFLPSFAGTPGVELVDCRPVSDDIVTAAVVDDDGEQTTAMTFALEQRRALGADGSWSGTAAVTAFGMTAEFYPDADTFARSERSLLDPAGADSPAPAHYREKGLMWPPRVAPESFFSWGTFPGDGDAVADARLNGVVLRAERRRNVATGRRFLAARVACLGFEVDLVAEWERDDVPAPGSIVATDAYLVATIDALTFNEPSSTPRRRWSLFGR